MRLAIVILNWNGEALLKQFLPSVIEHSGESPIYVIDNGSTDRSVSTVQKQFPEVKIIRLNTNHGFAGGYNLGLNDVDADIVCLLNNDVEVTPGWLMPVQDHFRSHENTAAMQPVIRDLCGGERPRGRGERACACANAWP